MKLTRPFQTWLLLLLITSALILCVHERELNHTLPNQSSSIHHINQTSLSPDIPANKVAVFCDGNQYGRDLVIADCRDAITGIPRTTQRARFGERSADPRTWDVGLPSRQIGSEDALEENSFSTTTYPSDYEAVQGLCTVQLELKPGRSSAIATSLDVFEAAVAVLRSCVAGPGINTGGLAIEIGGYLNE